MPEYPFMAPLYETKPAAQHSALSISCSACQAGIGVACEGPRVCAARLRAALDRMRAGELPEAAPAEAASHDDVSGCIECGKERTQRGHAVACGRPGHRCGRLLTGGQQCRRVAVAGRFCASHAPRWN